MDGAYIRRNFWLIIHCFIYKRVILKFIKKSSLLYPYSIDYIAYRAECALEQSAYPCSQIQGRLKSFQIILLLDFVLKKDFVSLTSIPPLISHYTQIYPRDLPIQRRIIEHKMGQESVIARVMNVLDAVYNAA